MPLELGGGAPDMTAIREQGQCAISPLDYIGYLIATRNWLAGDELTYADLAAAAHLSVVDYLGDVPWEENETAKHWYARINPGRPFARFCPTGFREKGPSEHHGNLDF